MAAAGGALDWLRDAAALVLTVGGALLFLAAVVLLALAAHRGWKRSRHTQVIIETLADATGDATAGGAAVGLTYRLREEVVTLLPVVADRAKRAVRAASDPTSPLRALMLEDIDRRGALLDDIASSQDDLMASMESMVPQAARGAYRIVASSLLRPEEVRVLGVLQRVSDHGGGLGLSFNVNHVGAEEAASRITLWEDEDRDVAGTTVVERCHALVVPAARALACELLRQRLKAATSGRSRRGRWRRRDDGHVDPEALVDLLVGSLYHSAAHGSAPATRSFYKLAERALRRSAEHLEHYTLSYQLANTLAEQGRRQGADRDKAIELLSQSTALLDQAARKLPAAALGRAQREAEELKIEAARTTNACLLAELLPDDQARAREAGRLACALTAVDPGAYESDALLYNVACALAVAARVTGLARHGAETERCVERAKVWLLHAGKRNDLWWTSGAADPDLCLLHAWMPDARRRLWEVGAELGDGPLDAKAVAACVERVLEAFRAVPV